MATRKRHAPLPITPDVVGMFNDYHFLLSGSSFDEKYSHLSVDAKRNYVLFSDLLKDLRAQRWKDELRPEQSGKYTFIEHPQMWEKVAAPFSSSRDD